MFDLYIIIAFLTSLFSLIVLRPFCSKLNLIDYPSERKNHVGNVPLLGGISVFLGLLTSYLFSIEFYKFSSVLLITASLILIHGVWDDITNLKVRIKIVFQVIVSLIMIYVADLQLNSLGDLFGVSYPLQLGIFSFPITIIAVIGLTNAINMIDGIDGLAAGLVLIAITGIICFNATSEFSPFTSVLLATASALLPFFICNIAPYKNVKIFLGDGGSLFLGYIISWALIYNAENINSFTHNFALWCVAIPLFDFFAVIILRILKKQSLTIARKDHIHHFLENLGLSQNLILLIILSCGFTMMLIGFFIENYVPTLSFPVFLILFFCFLFIRIYNKPD